ncbi:MAG: TonB-dependent receptor [Vicinamibacterales bacterium]
MPRSLRALRSHSPQLAFFLVVAWTSTSSTFAQTSTSSGTAGQASQPSSPPLRITVPPLTVTAQKEPADPQSLPVSVTTVSSDTLRGAGIVEVSEAGVYSPNTYFSELSARKISNVRFRGIGTSPANPGVTTYIDGVPQLNTTSSSVQFLNVEQVEFVRGPQSALFGRNTLGGLINISSAPPSLSRWTGNLSAPFGNVSSREVRGNVSGPVRDNLAVQVGVGYGERDGFTINDLSGNDLDFRSATFAKGQMMWQPARHWEARLVVSGERARDGDYALNDLDAIRATPFHVTRDFEGRTERDIFNTTVLTRREGERVTLTTTTGFVRWTTNDLTDLDYTPLPLATRSNAEEDFQFTQELRLASAPKAPLSLTDSTSLRWQSGIFLFTQRYDQNAVNNLAPFILDPRISFPVSQTSPQSALDDWGLGVYGQGTVTVADRVDLTAGVRVDHERKEAVLDTFFTPVVAPPTSVLAEKSFSNISPQFAVVYNFQPDRLAYASVARGYKAGGFNPASPSGSEAYDEEYTWHLEGGAKTTWGQGRLVANAAMFYIDWNDLQLNVPNPFVPAQFYIANVGGATSTGIELELNATPAAGLDLFGSFGLSRARFANGSRSAGFDISDNDVPLTPDFQTTLGAQITRPVRAAMSVYGLGELVVYGAFKYDEANTVGQDAYSLANFRGGVRGRLLFAEAWIKNAFDTTYVPIAFAYTGFAPSGFIGEPGRPRTFGINVGVTF